MQSRTMPPHLWRVLVRLDAPFNRVNGKAALGLKQEINDFLTLKKSW